MVALLLGLAIGTVMGLTGAGGGILAVPALVFVVGLPLADAAPVALVAVAGAAALGTVEGLRRGLVRYRAALFMAAIGMMLSPLGLKAARLAPERALLLGFAGVLLLAAWRMFASAGTHDSPALEESVPCHVDPSTGRLRWTARTAAALGAIGGTAGFFTGLLGVGGGFLIVPALRRYSDITMQGIVATSLAVIALVATGTVIASVLRGQPLDWPVIMPFAAGAAAGVLAGRVGARRLKPQSLQRLFGTVAIVVAAGMAGRALLGA